MKHLLFLLLIVMSLTSCSENFSNGERIGLVTQFSETGLIWKSWEGHLNMTQTGMNSSQAFDFSIDNDNVPQGLVAKLDSAARFGYKVQLKYHETRGWNWFNNRGNTNHFISECNILDRTPMQSIFGQGQSTQHGIVRDTIYVVIFKNK
jgi:hypothetical protein